MAVLTTSLGDPRAGVEVVVAYAKQCMSMGPGDVPYSAYAVVCKDCGLSACRAARSARRSLHASARQAASRSAALACQLGNFPLRNGVSAQPGATAPIWQPGGSGHRAGSWCEQGGALLAAP